MTVKTHVRPRVRREAGAGRQTKLWALFVLSLLFLPLNKIVIHLKITPTYLPVHFKLTS